MKKIIAAFAFVLISFAAVSAQTNMDTTFMTMEKGAWDAFGKGDGKYFETFLADDAMLGSETGFATKAQSIKDISTKPCELKSYSFSNFKVAMLDKNTALITYEATQNVTCGGQAGPGKIYGTSVYVKRKGKWLAAFHNEITAMTMK
ncbi:MAG TPA: nuclear transport factor 2 family protein [Pyrinomonadaceae bacterium]|jgi:hypothetical protein